MRIVLLIIALLAAPFAAAAKDVQRPVTVLVGIDGFRADYLERGVTPRLSALAKAGTSAAMRPSLMPTSPLAV